jgi:hypothetical protein
LCSVQPSGKGGGAAALCVDFSIFAHGISEAMWGEVKVLKFPRIFILARQNIGA